MPSRLSQLAGFDEVQSRISMASRMSTTPEGAGWKTSMVPLVSVMSMVSR